jgi:hypothetical protein
MVRLIAVLALTAGAWAGAFAGAAATTPSSPVDREFIRKIDVTGDGKSDTITLRVKGKDLSSPFTWTLSILSLEKTILSHTSNDRDINNLFADEGYVEGCKGYVECKSKWYFTDILANIVIPKSGYALEGIMPSIDAVAGEYLANQLSMRGDKAKAAIAGIKSRLQKGQAIVISIPTSPVTSGPIMVYSPEVSRFIEIGQD